MDSYSYGNGIVNIMGGSTGGVVIREHSSANTMGRCAGRVLIRETSSVNGGTINRMTKGSDTTFLDKGKTSTQIGALQNSIIPGKSKMFA